MYPESEPGLVPAAQRRDREFTLGPAFLGTAGAGLLVLCCICFIAGYEFGSHGTTLPGLKGPAVSDKIRSAAEILATAKPTAAPPAPAPRPAAPVVTLTKAAVQPSDPGLPTAAPPPAAVTATQAAQPAPDSTAPQPIEANPAVRPALAQVTPSPFGAPWRVHIAAVDQQADANVLVSALRQRGYSVSVRHDHSDGLLHVQVGPYLNRSDAEAARQKLLNDGYNAVLEQ